MSQLYLSPLYLTAMLEPVFIKKPEGATIISPGAPYFIDCNAVGQPQPVIVWRKDGQLLDQFNTTK